MILCSGPGSIQARRSHQAPGPGPAGPPSLPPSPRLRRQQQTATARRRHTCRRTAQVRREPGGGGAFVLLTRCLKVLCDGYSPLASPTS